MPVIQVCVVNQPDNLPSGAQRTQTQMQTCCWHVRPPFELLMLIVDAHLNIDTWVTHTPFCISNCRVGKPGALRSGRAFLLVIFLYKKK